MASQLKISAQIVTKIVPLLFALIFFALTIWLLLSDKTISATASFGFAVIVFILANLDRFESFKGFGVEAKTRDLRNAINDAESVLARLENMGKEVTELSDSVTSLRGEIDETRSLARRARALAFMGGH
jgi:hypothetical protein